MTLASKIISGLLAFLMFHSPAFGLGGNKAENNTSDGKTVTITVAQDGSGDYATLEEARDYVRTLDKTKYSGIDVVIKDGKYQAEKTFKLTAEDSGTKNCPVRYIGDGDARLYGGVAFTADDFEPLGDGEVVKYFPEEVKDKLVQIDLKKFGFKAEDARDIANSLASYPKNPTFLYCNGEKMSIARFPNENENFIDGWARVGAGSTLEPEWTEIAGNPEADYYVVRFADEYNERVHSWHNIYDGFVKGRLRYLWCSDDTSVAYLDPEEPLMKLYFTGGYEPREGMVFFWYHIPEELDIPGEYYVDNDCILYYYPTDAHKTATYTMPTLDENIITFDGAEYITIDNLTIEASRGDGISGCGNNITIQNCTVQGVLRNGINLKNSTEITVQNNKVTSTGKSGISVCGGDEATFTRANNLIYNNYVSDWSTVRGLMEFGIHGCGCGVTISHNEVCHSVDWGIEVGGVDVLVEYNHIYDVARFEGDQAAIHVCTTFGGIVRYNYVHDAGFDDDHIDFMGIAGIDSDYPVGQVETYGNIVANVTGAGHLIPGSYIADVHDNLYISCRRGAVNYTDQNYTNILHGATNGSFELEDYMTSELWLERFPFLGELKTTLTDEEVEALDDTPITDLDPNYWFVPSGSSVKNNYVYIDKANLADPGKGLTKPYIYYELCAEFSEIVEPTSDEITVYSSKRSGHPDIREALEKAAGTINLPYEEFEKIGRVK